MNLQWSQQRNVILKIFCSGNKLLRIKKIINHRLEGNDISDKGLVARIYLKILKLNIKKTNHPIKTGQRMWTDNSLKTVYEWKINTWKDVQNH